MTRGAGPAPGAGIAALQPYRAEAGGRGAFLRCEFNENPRGCSPAVLERLRRLAPSDVSLYPDETEARAAAAAWFGLASLSAELDLLFTAGMDEGIRLVTEAFAGPARTVALPVPSFSMYGICAELSGARRVEVSYADDLSFPEASFRRAVASGAEVAILPDPNNPTGTPLPPGLAAGLADAFPETLVFVDEAYAEYAGRTSLPDLAGRPNLVIGRTFSKAYGLAGLRLGVLLGHRDTLGWMARIRAPYPVASASLAALPAALADAAWVRRSVEESHAALQRLAAGLARLGVEAAGQSGSFTMARFGARAEEVLAGLHRRGCLVKPLGGHPLVAGCLRVSPGTVEIADRFLALLAETLQDIGWEAAR